MTADPIEDLNGPPEESEFDPYPLDQDTPQRPWRIQSKDDFLYVLSLRWEHEQNIAALKRRIHNLEAMISDEMRQIDSWTYRFAGEVQELTADMLDGTKRRSIKTEFGTAGFRMGRASLRVRDSKAAIEWCREAAPDAIVTDERLITGPLQGRGDLPAALFEMRPAVDHFFILQAPKT